MVSTGAGLQDLSGPPGPAGCRLWSSGRVFPTFLFAFLLCLWCITLEYAFISHFKGVFRGFWGVRVGLYRLRALRGLWGFCARVELGGLEACGVFASMLSSRLPFVFFSCPLVLLTCLASCLACFPALCLAFLALWLILGFLFGLLFLFPFRYIRKKKGRDFLRPLLSCCGLVISS